MMCAGLAWAQAAQQPAQPAAQPAQAPAARPAPAAPGFHSLVTRDDKGAAKVLNEPLDVLAIGNNHLITAEDRKRISKATAAWFENVDQLAIDNLDFMEAIEPLDGSPGLLQKLDLNDPKQIHKLSVIMTQLMAAGTLTSELQNQGVITSQQAGVNMQIVTDYQQVKMNEMVASTGGQQNLTPEQQAEQTRQITAFLYGMTCRDTLESYRRLMAEAGPVADKAVAELKLPADLAPLAAQAKAATDNDARRAAVRALLAKLDFGQRQAFLRKTRELNPPVDPLAGLGPVKAAPGQ